MKILKIQVENHENHENLIIPYENHEIKKTKNVIIPFENHENHGNQRIPSEIRETHGKNKNQCENH